MEVWVDGMGGGGRMNWCWCLLTYRFLLTLSLSLSLPSFQSSDHRRRAGWDEFHPQSACGLAHGMADDVRGMEIEHTNSRGGHV